MNGWTEEDRIDLERASRLLEGSGIARRLTSVLGTPIERGFELLPERWSESVSDATRASMDRALRFAVRTLPDRPGASASNWGHRIAAAATGAAGGSFGLAALSVELPVSTLVMLRSIADVARSEGESVRAIETQLQCVEVFALGGRTAEDDAAETAYYAVRAALARSVSDAAGHIARYGLSAPGAPALVRLVGRVAQRFGVVVSQKVAAQAIPILGAAGGAMVNTIFIGHFQDVARGHFIVRRLERAYGTEAVEAAYRGLRGGDKSGA